MSPRPEQSSVRGFRPRLLLPLLGLTILVAVATACKASSGPTTDVAGSIPWPATESLNYAVQNKKGENLGKIVLAVESSGGSTKLSQLFDGSTSKDDLTVTVDSKTLKPVSSEREIKNSKDDTKITADYTPQGVLIKQGDKQSGLSVPDHSYDNDTSLFLWRTLPFADGYEANYVTIVTNRRTKQNVHLHVLSRETVNVQAGSFQAWHLQITAGGITQNAWYADTATKQLVKYDNDNGLIYELAK